MRDFDGWTPMVDVAHEAGYPKGTGSKSAFLEVIRGLTETKQLGIGMHGGGRPAWMVPTRHADDVVKLLRERREKTVRRVPMPQQAVAARFVKSEPDSREFEVTVRRLIHLAQKLGIDTITIQDGEAEVTRSQPRVYTIKG